VLFCDPEAYADIYSMKSNVRRSQFYTALKRNKDDNMTINTIDVGQHAYKRKILNLCFTDKLLRGACEFIVKHVDRWNQLILEEIDGDDWSASVDITEKIDVLTFDIMGDLCFGRSFDVKEPGENPLKAVTHCKTEYLLFYYPVSSVLMSCLEFYAYGLVEICYTVLYRIKEKASTMCFHLLEKSRLLPVT
jgi:hypothetical protein